MLLAALLSLYQCIPISQSGTFWQRLYFPVQTTKMVNVNININHTCYPIQMVTNLYTNIPVVEWWGGGARGHLPPPPQTIKIAWVSK